MLEWIENAGIMAKGGFIAIAGLLLVFAVLVLFFFSIKLLGKIGKNGEQKEGLSK